MNAPRQCGLWCGIVFGVVLVLSAAVPVSADVVFSDNFEAQTSYVPSSTDADPGASPVGDGWTVDEVTEAYVQVHDNTSTSFDTPYGSKYLRLYRAGSGNCIAYGDFTLGAPAPQLSLAFDFYRDTNGAINFGFYDGATQVNALLMNNDSFGESGRAGNLQGGSWVRVTALDGSVLAGQWIHAEMVVDFVTDTYSMTIGTQTATGLPLLGDFSTASRVRFVAGGGWEDPRYGIDNVVVTAIPEPGALAILASGLLGLICYAWRRRR